MMNVESAKTGTDNPLRPIVMNPTKPKDTAEFHFMEYKENRNPYKKLSGQWNQYENWFLNAKLREENHE